MNREEATQWLEQIKNFLIYGGDEKFDERRKEAIDMAIQALEQEPFEDATHDKGTETHARVCEDAISRQEVLDLANNLVDTAVIPCRPFLKGVNALPSVQPIRSVKGLIENINNLSDTIRGIRSDGNCFFTPEEVIKIIKEYCGLEENNG